MVDVWETLADATANQVRCLDLARVRLVNGRGSSRRGETPMSSYQSERVAAKSLVGGSHQRCQFTATCKCR